jgi:hypothetical protein
MLGITGTDLVKALLQVCYEENGIRNLSIVDEENFNQGKVDIYFNVFYLSSGTSRGRARDIFAPYFLEGKLFVGSEFLNET